jgi:hypothetical protein
MSDARTPDQRIAAIQRYGDPITPQQRYDAAALLRDVLAAAARHGVTLADFDGVVDLPGGCLDAVLARRVRA